MKLNNPSLLAAMLTASYLSRISNRRPNPTPTNASLDARSKDFLRYMLFIPSLREWIILTIQTVHIIITAQYPPTSRSLLVPKPEILNPRYFTWNSFTFSWLAVCITAASIRMAAFRELGKNFTFELARPAKLVTSGMYAYVQHPSYPTDIAVTWANLVLFANPDGWIGGFLPDELRELWLRYRWITQVGLGLGAAVMFGTRVRQEEEMLRQAYGKEWEAWHRRTARFIPFVI